MNACDPAGEKARAVKARYQGVCRGCGAPTQARNGKGDAYQYCKACRPGAIKRRWTRERVLDAMRGWRACYGRLPSSYDWSRTHAERRGGEPLERLSDGDWPSASVVTETFGSWAAARAVADEAEVFGKNAAGQEGTGDVDAIADVVRLVGADAGTLTLRSSRGRAPCSTARGGSPPRRRGIRRGPRCTSCT
jgi:hypothetical protein